VLSSYPAFSVVAAETSMTDKPNVVICMCDQLRAFEVGCYGNDVVQTPHIDALAARGVRFDLAVTNNPVCMAARSSLLTGQYTRTCQGFLGNYMAPDSTGSRPQLPEYPEEERRFLPDPTVAEQLKAIGYETVLFGKWHIQPAPHLLGFDYSLYPRVHHRHTGQAFVENRGEGEVVEGFSVDFEARQVREYLDGIGERPFFMFYSISPPHMPLDDAPEKYLDMFSPEEVPLRPNVYVDGKLAHDENWFKIYLWDFLYYQEHLPYTETLPDGFDLRHLTARYYGLTTWVDDTVGRLMTGLRQNRLDENTIVVFLSDHGDNLGSHHLFNKSMLIEESIRIPMIWFGPGITTAADDQQVAQLIDVMPTILDLCGGCTPDSVQGRSLAPILRGLAEPSVENHAFIETDKGAIGLRTDGHLYGLQLDEAGNPADAGSSFFDLTRDPFEQNNLAVVDEQKALAAELKSKLCAWNATTPRLDVSPDH
jgi:choline-sulfatase